MQAKGVISDVPFDLPLIMFLVNQFYFVLIRSCLRQSKKLVIYSFALVYIIHILLVALTPSDLIMCLSIVAAD